jgi:hypothetical protein
MLSKYQKSQKQKTKQNTNALKLNMFFVHFTSASDIYKGMDIDVIVLLYLYLYIYS